MKAVRVEEFGGPEVLVLKNIEKPAPKEGEVLIKMTFSTVNMVDTYFRKGIYPSDLPFTIGVDGCGVVEGFGEGVDGFKVGDRVAFYFSSSCAEYACIPAIKVFKIPESAKDEEGCSLMVNGLTAHYLTRTTYPIKKGDIALVHACAGGTGQLIIQICKIMGATVIGTCSTPEKAQFAKDLGADFVVNYKEKDFVKEVEEICKKLGRKGCNVAYDGVGKATYEGSMDCLDIRGYLILFGNASGVVPPIDPLLLAKKGSIYVTRPTLRHHVLSEEEKNWRIGELFQWVQSKKLVAKIHKVFNMDKVTEAHQEIEGRKTFGKILIKI